MLSQCLKCGLSKSSGVMGSVLPQCRCDWNMPTPQRTWVGLTDEEIIKAFETSGHKVTIRPQDVFAVTSMARAIEAKLKEKNT
jgi:hypothetical protein